MPIYHRRIREIQNEDLMFELSAYVSLKRKEKKNNNFTTLRPFQFSLCGECYIFTLVMKQSNLHSSDGDNQLQGPAKGCSADNDNTVVCIIDNMQWGLLQAQEGWTQSKHQYQLYMARNPLRYRIQEPEV